MNRLRGRVPRGWRLYLYVVAVNLSVIGSNRVELRHLYSYGGVRGPVTSIAWAFGRHLISQPRLLVTRQSLLSSVLSPHLTMCICICICDFFGSGQDTRRIRVSDDRRLSNPTRGHRLIYNNHSLPTDVQTYRQTDLQTYRLNTSTSSVTSVSLSVCASWR
jgi:hypothetical protein